MNFFEPGVTNVMTQIGEADMTSLFRFSFDGRLDRTRFVLALCVILSAFVAFVQILFGSVTPFRAGEALAGSQIAAVATTAIVAVLLATYVSALGVKRLHDSDLAGWWILPAFVPVVGLLWSLVLIVRPGSGGPNRYGPPTVVMERGVERFYFDETGAVDWPVYALTVLLVVVGLRALCLLIAMSAGLAVAVATHLAHVPNLASITTPFAFKDLLMWLGWVQAMSLMRVMRYSQPLP